MAGGQLLTSEQQTALRAFHEELSLWRAVVDGPLPEFFWRDDDATSLVSTLEGFLELSEKRKIAIAFAAIPTQLTVQTARAIRSSSYGRIAVHGFGHENHAPQGVPDSEYPLERPQQEVLAELRKARLLIQDKARERYLSMFVPPWGRFDETFDPLLKEARLQCFSGNHSSGRRAVALQYNCQITIEHGTKPVDLAAVLERVTKHLEVRRARDSRRLEPIGLITHHRMFSPELHEQLDAFLAILQDAGVKFSTFGEIDALAKSRGDDYSPTKRTLSDRPSAPPSVDASASVGIEVAATALLSRRTLPAPGEEPAGLLEVLNDLGKTNALSILRYTQLKDALVRQVPSGRVLSAGCGKGLAELALSLQSTEHSCASG